MDCIFCKIVSGEIPTEKIYEDDEVVAFRDIHPKAPTHVLLIPRRHIEKLSDLQPEDAELAGRLLLAVKKVAAVAGVDQNGFRVIVNNGRFAGQEVFHLHFHILGGKPMSWNPA